MKSIIGAAFFALVVAVTPATAAPLANTRVFAQAGAGQTQLVDWDDWHNRWRSHHRWGSHGEWGGGWDGHNRWRSHHRWGSHREWGGGWGEHHRWRSHYRWGSHREW